MDALWAPTRGSCRRDRAVAGRAAAARRPDLRRRGAAGDARFHPRAAGTSHDPPGEEIADFEEYTQLFRESWSDPDIRWLLATVPSAMIFDDHEVNDDWNISQSWVDEMRALPWWDERVIGAFMSYWLYQHLGNLSPPSSPKRRSSRRCRRDEDAGPRLREFARMCDRESAASRWAYYRDFGRSRLLVIDSRAARVLADGRRDMVDADEWDWISEHARGSFDHLIVATTLPVFVPHGIHYLEAWNEAVCAGRWGSARGPARRAAATRVRPRALGRVSALVRAAHRSSARSQRRHRRRAARDDHDPERRRPHDVHGRGRSRADAGPSRVYQVVCSPFRNPLTPSQRRDRHGGRIASAAARVFSLLARAGRRAAARRSWSYLARRTFDNSIGELEPRRGGCDSHHLPGQARGRARGKGSSASRCEQLADRASSDPAPRPGESERRAGDRDDRGEHDPEER